MQNYLTGGGNSEKTAAGGIRLIPGEGRFTGISTIPVSGDFWAKKKAVNVGGPLGAQGGTQK